MTHLVAKPFFSPTAKAYAVKIYDGDTVVKTLPCLDERGWNAKVRADIINATGKDPYGYYKA